MSKVKKCNKLGCLLPPEYEILCPNNDVYEFCNKHTDFKELYVEIKHIKTGEYL